MDAVAGSVLVAGSAPPFWFPSAQATGAAASTAINRVVRVHFVHIADSLTISPVKEQPRCQLPAMRLQRHARFTATTCTVRDTDQRSVWCAITVTRDHGSHSDRR